MSTESTAKITEPGTDDEKGEGGGHGYLEGTPMECLPFFIFVRESFRWRIDLSPMEARGPLKKRPVLNLKRKEEEAIYEVIACQLDIANSGTCSVTNIMQETISSLHRLDRDRVSIPTLRKLSADSNESAGKMVVSAFYPPS